MARAFLRLFKAHSYSYATKMIDKKAPSGRVRSSRGSAAQTPVCGVLHTPNPKKLWLKMVRLAAQTLKLCFTK